MFEALAKKGLIKKNSEFFTAINLGGSAIKGITLKQGKVVDYFIEPKQSIPEAIDAVRKKEKIIAKKIKISLKDPSCLIRYFSFPKVEPKKLRQALYYQLSKLIPYAPNDVYFDYAVLKANSSQLNMLLAVAKKNQVEDILAVFEEKGFLVSEVTLDSIALMNLYFSRYIEDGGLNSCILDIGYNFSTINIMEKGVPFLNRETKFSSRDILGIISRVKNLSEQEAAVALKEIDSESSLQPILEENLSDWCKEIKNSFDFFELNKGQNLNKLYITGGMAAITGIETFFSQNLEVETKVLIPENQDDLLFSQGSLAEKYQACRHALSVCFGLI